MWFLYFLLIIIAIGVLLLSREGKAFLSLISTVCIIAAMCYLGFWAVVILFGFAVSDTGKNIASLVGFLIILFILANFIERFINKHKEKLQNNWIVRNKKMLVWLFWIIWILLTVSVFVFADFASNYEILSLWVIVTDFFIFPIIGLILYLIFSLKKLSEQ